MISELWSISKKDGKRRFLRRVNVDNPNAIKTGDLWTIVNQRHKDGKTTETKYRVVLIQRVTYLLNQRKYTSMELDDNYYDRFFLERA